MNDLLQQFKQRDAGPLVQFIKYGISGGVATAVHICLFYLLAWKLMPALSGNDVVAGLLHMPVQEVSDAIRSRNSMIDNFLAFLVSNLTAYILNILWVFKPGRHHPVVEIAMFYAVSGVSIFVGTSIMGFLIRYYGMMTTVAFCANLVSALLINYAMRKFVIFKG
jgi:putative flippase GtrA